MRTRIWLFRFSLLCVAFFLRHPSLVTYLVHIYTISFVIFGVWFFLVHARW